LSPQVINTVTAIVNHLPASAFDSPPPSPPDSLTANGANAQENNIREMVETERKYVQDLEIMQVRPFHVSFRPPSPKLSAEILECPRTGKYN
jgi:hypothetical protein